MSDGGGGGGGGGGSFAADGSSPGRMSVPKLMEHAQQLVDRCDPDYALKFLQRAHKIEPANMDVVDMMAEVAMQMADLDLAKKYLEHSIKVVSRVCFMPACVVYGLLLVSLVGSAFVRG